MLAPVRHKTFRFYALILPSFAMLFGCATQPYSKAIPLWQSREQFVSLVARDDMGTGREGQNRHPVSLATSELRAALASLVVELPDTSKPVALFGNSELDILSEQMHVGLQQAGADQDLIFAVLGEISLLKGFASVEVVTTGRVFYRENGLNLILGMVRERVRESDRRLQPFVPGSRLRVASLPGPVSTASALAVHVLDRPDWLVLAVGTEGTAQKPMPDAARQDSAAPEVRKEVPAVVPKDRTGGTAAGKDFEKRLRILGELRAKGLITEDEYRAKKESILKEL